jgi:predicted ferric reductase
MHRRSLLLFLLGICDVAVALRSGKYCFEGCDLTLAYVTFNDSNAAAGSKKIRTCLNELHWTSLYLCFHEYCNDAGRDLWIAEQNDRCLRLGNVSVPSYSIIDEYSPEDVAGLRRLRAGEGMWDSEPMVLSEAALPDQPFFERAFKTLDYAFFEVDTHWAYGVALYWFWIFVVAFGIGLRLISSIQSLRRKGGQWQPIPGTEEDVEEQVSKRTAATSLPYALLKSYIIFPATFSYRCSQSILRNTATIPPRIQSLTIFAFVFLNTLLCCISYRVFSENLYWPEISTQLWRYVSDRTGVLSLANFPLIWLFGTRNNVLMWLTGWGFGCYNNFHRWAARVATVQAVVHSIGYTEMIFERGTWATFMKYWSKHYFWNGEIATILMVGLCCASVYPLRRCHYEIFLITHIVLSIIVLITTFYHVEIFNGEWNIFIYPCLAIWILDRSIRSIRILAFNRRFWNTKAVATYDHASNLIRLEVPCSQSMVKPQPGTYYYIHVLNDLLFAHQNHPFTLSYVAQPDHNASTPLSPLSSRPQRPGSRRTPSASSNSSTESESLLQPSSPKSPSLVFLIRPYDGFTARLMKKAISQPKTLRVWVEGAYGETNALHQFSDVLFVVGGTGIAVPLSYLARLLEDGNRVQNVHIVWAVREHGFLNDVLRHDMRSEWLRDERLRLTVHVTQDEELKDDINSGRVHPSSMTLKAGRPDVDLAVDESAEDSEGGSLAVVACGPAQMADDARRASVRALGRGHRQVEYFEESFKW